MYMLAEHGELLAQVTIQRRYLLEARLGENFALEPSLERVGAAAADPYVKLVSRKDKNVADVLQLR